MPLWMRSSSGSSDYFTSRSVQPAGLCHIAPVPEGCIISHRRLRSRPDYVSLRLSQRRGLCLITPVPTARIMSHCGELLCRTRSHRRLCGRPRSPFTELALGGAHPRKARGAGKRDQNLKKVQARHMRLKICCLGTLLCKNAFHIETF